MDATLEEKIEEMENYLFLWLSVENIKPETRQRLYKKMNRAAKEVQQLRK
jgi:predicted DNA-binding protein